MRTVIPNIAQLRERKRLSRAEVSRRARIPYRKLARLEEGRPVQLSDAQRTQLLAHVRARKAVMQIRVSA